jgi:hypothetical protein
LRPSCGCCGTILPRCFCRHPRDWHHRTCHHRAIETPTTGGQPIAGANRHLNGSPQTTFGFANGVVQTVAIGFTQNQEINVANRTIAVFAGEARSPRTVDVGLVDAFDFGERGTKHPRHTKGSDEYFGQATEVGAADVCANKSGSPDQTTRRQSRCLRPLNFAMNRGIRSVGSFDEIGQRVLDGGFTQKKGQDLGLLLRAKDWQE